MVNLHFGFDYLLYFVLFSFSSAGIIQFQPNDTPCLGLFQEYQCNVSEGILEWSVRDSNNVAVVGTVLYSSGSIGTNSTVDQFSFEQLERTPDIISNVSFTVQSSRDGYSIQCRREGTSINETIVINIPDTDSPTDIIIHTDTFTSTSVNISWTESSSSCVTVYRYNVSSVTVGSIIMESTTSNNVLVEGLVPSDEEYCVIVTAVDTGNRTSNGSDPPVCLILNIPPKPIITNITNVTISSSYDSIAVNWRVDYTTDPNVAVAPITVYIVNIFNTTEDFNDTSDRLPGTSTSHTFTDVPKGINYTIEVIAINVVGNSSMTQFFPGPSNMNPTSTSSTSSSTQTSTTSFPIMSSSTIATSPMPTSGTTPPVNPTSGNTSSGGLPLPAIVGAVIGAIILILVIVIIVIVVIILYKKYNSVKSDGGNHGDPIPLVSKHMPETGQAALYQDPDTIKRQEAPTGDMYALPDRGSKRRPPPAGPELATYQDPDTIRREAAHTGDLYAQPDKKPMYTEVNKQAKAAGGMYAELDHMTPISPSERPLLNSDFQQPPQVVYSAVKH